MAFTSDEGAREQGFKGMIAPPTLCSIYVREVQLPDIGLDFGSVQMHAGQRVQPIAPIYAGDTISASSHLKDVYAKTGPLRHHGVRSLGNHLSQPGWRSGR